jgi:endonuclease/exonuclease/phosphatase family metal-dependent hydrolase
MTQKLSHWLVSVVVVALFILPQTLQTQALPNNTTAVASQPLRLASWNIRHLSKKRSSEGMEIIANIIHNYDFVNIIEVKDREVVNRLCDLLSQEYNLSYAYEISPAVGRGSKEHYCFLYNQKRVRLLQPGRLYPDPDDVFMREPFYATFACGQFDFTVISIHVVWGTHVGERRKEITQLANVFRHIQGADPEENDVLLLGDFNRPPEDDLAFGALKSVPDMVYLFGEPTRTMIGDTNLYDNIWMQRHFVREFTDTQGMVRFDESVFARDRAAALRLVSDHRPVWASFTTCGTDDD